VLDRAVFASRVHRLEDEQQRPAILGVKHILLLCEPLGAALEEFGRLALVQLEAAGVAGKTLGFEGFEGAAPRSAASRHRDLSSVAGVRRP
jgi:hypothetical protein